MATFSACARFVRMSPRKARQVADLIRGKGVEEATGALEFCNRSAGRVLNKVVRSAAANALNQEGSGKLDVEDLFVSRVWVDGGPTMKRFRPQSRGRAFRIRKRTSHLHVEVAVKE
ncbi:50S ribosomal protein L22 [Candidatus Fermentibacteria bacterium]|nr:50S ribosomal protein L22 [Candidatus Fermentibacteria bacterium]